MNLAADAEAHGKAVGLGKGMAETGGIANSFMQKAKVVGFGRDQSIDTFSSMRQGAVRASNLALAASEAKFQRNLSDTSAIAGVAGAATRKWGGDLVDKWRFNPNRKANKARLVDSGMNVPDFDFSGFGEDPLRYRPMDNGGF